MVRFEPVLNGTYWHIRTGKPKQVCVSVESDIARALDKREFLILFEK